MSVPWHGANKGRGRVLYGVHQIWAGFCAILAWLSTVRVRSLTLLLSHTLVRSGVQNFSAFTTSTAWNPWNASLQICPEISVYGDAYIASSSTSLREKIALILLAPFFYFSTHFDRSLHVC